MAEVGHSSPGVTLTIYAQVMRRDKAARERLGALLEGRLLGTIGHWKVSAPEDLSIEATAETTEPPRLQGLRTERATGLEPATFSLEG